MRGTVCIGVAAGRGNGNCRRWAMAAALVAALALPGWLAAQNITSTLAGTVTDPSGAVVPGATVTVHNDDTNQHLRVVQTDASGTYTATLLPIGTYTVTITAHGFQNAVLHDVIVHAGERRALNAALKPGAITQTVTVTTSATPVQTSSAAQSQTLSGTQVRQLQLNNRNFEQLIVLQPGVSSQLPDQVGFGLQNTSAVSVNGARVSANNWTTDGADINDSGSNA
ncbi:MAG: carboxypeptidase-like regulatory domain-containing protein, partial [Gammaproteobacteria bacterium]